MDGICVGLISTIILIINTLPFVVSQQGFISIDCGATEDHFDSRTKIDWTNDNAYSNIGESSTLPEDVEKDYDHELRTARSFPTCMKNCYEINTANNTKYLLRVRFLYANFYLTGQNHTMYLIIDDDIIQSLKPSTGTGTFEFIITAVSDVTSVCFGRVNGDPFVNIIELRKLKRTMYPLVDRGTILSIVHQRATGSEYDIDIIRHPNDTYDRFWVPEPFPELDDIETSGNQTCAENTVDKVPFHLMRNGVRSNCSIEGSGNIDGYEIALTFYFAEFANQGDRVIDISLAYDTLDGDSVSFSMWSDLPSGSCTLPYIRNEIDFGLIDTTYNFSIQSVKPLFGCHVTDIPPDVPHDRSISPYAILNAWHASSPRYRSQDRTNTAELAIMKSIKEHFNITKWTGDPCLPVNFTWDRVKCHHHGSIATVKSMNLSEMNLTNTVPDFFSQLTSLEMLDLSNNNLYGELPDTLFENHLLKVDYSNNPNLRKKVHGLTTTERNILIGIVVPIGIIALFVGFLACRHFRGKTLEQYTKDTTETQGGESTKTSKWQVPWLSPIIKKDPTQT